MNFQNILDNRVAFLHEFAEEKSSMLQHGCLSQFSINTLIIAMTLCLAMQYFCTTLLSMAMTLESCVAHIILVMPALSCEIFLQIFLQQLQRNKTSASFLVCAIWTEADRHAFHFSIILCIKCWKDNYFSIIFQFVNVRMKSEDIYRQLITWKFNWSLVSL